MESKVGSNKGEKGSWATVVTISVDDVSILVEEGLEVHHVAPDCNAGGDQMTRHQAIRMKMTTS